jgi:tripartite-type tricarboxylate transporter receptor subunit TctC
LPRRSQGAAVTGTRRALCSQRAHLAESGGPAPTINYWGIVAPAGTAEAIARLNAEVNRVLAQQDVRERWAGKAIVAGPSASARSSNRPASWKSSSPTGGWSRQ